MENYNTNDWVVETVTDENILGSAGDTPPTFTADQPQQEIPGDKAYGSYQEQGAAPQSTTVNMGSIPAEAVIEAGDKIIASLAVMVCGFFDIEVTKKDVALTAAEKTSLEKPVENYLKTQNVTLSPGQALLLQIGGIYTAKAITIYSQQEPREKAVNLDGIPDLNDIGKVRKQGQGQAGKKRGPYKKKS